MRVMMGCPDPGCSGTLLFDATSRRPHTESLVTACPRCARAWSLSGGQLTPADHTA